MKTIKNFFHCSILAMTGIAALYWSINSVQAGGDGNTVDLSINNSIRA